MARQMETETEDVRVSERVQCTCVCARFGTWAAFDINLLANPTPCSLNSLLSPHLIFLPTQVAFLIADNRVLNGPLGRSPSSFTRITHVAHLLQSTPLCNAIFSRLPR